MERGFNTLRLQDERPVRLSEAVVCLHDEPRVHLAFFIMNASVAVTL